LRCLALHVAGVETRSVEGGKLHAEAAQLAVIDHAVLHELDVDGAFILDDMDAAHDAASGTM